MELMDLVFALVKNFSPVDPIKLAMLQNKALLWRTSIQEDLVEREKPFSKFYLKINEPWWMQLAFAIAYVPIVKWMQSEKRDGDDKDEEM